MQGFSWLIVVPIFVLCATIIGLRINLNQREKFLQSPLLCFAVSTNDSKWLPGAIEEDDKQATKYKGSHLNGDFSNYIQ